MHHLVASESLGYFVGRAVVVAVALGALGLFGVAIRWLGRWARRAVLADITHAIREVTSVDIAELKQGQTDMRAAFGAMRDENTDQHKQMRERLDHLEQSPPMTTTTTMITQEMHP